VSVKVSSKASSREDTLPILFIFQKFYTLMGSPKFCSVQCISSPHNWV
jgi:hypothetical protein